MTRDEIIAEHPLVAEFEERGIKLIGSGPKKMAKCPWHPDAKASMSVDTAKGVWFCHAGCGGGSVIDLMAKFDGISPEDILRRYAAPRSLPPPRPKTQPPASTTIDRIYSYTDELGREVYQVVKFKPKDFRQRHSRQGAWVWSMAGIERVLYRLPEVKAASEVWIVEGEKDAETLVALGFCATCNVGGANKWLDAYTETLKGKDIVLCGDNDKAGQEHIETVLESIAGEVKSSRRVTVPSPFKDVSEYVKSFAQPTEARSALASLLSASKIFSKGVHIPIFSMMDLEAQYKTYARNLDSAQFNLRKWLPTIGNNVRGLVPGELVTIVADTGVGKTALLHNLALSANPLPTLFFELELPPEMMFERFIANRTGFTCQSVEDGYRAGDELGQEFLAKFTNLFICTESRVTPEGLETIINRAELRMGVRPQVVVLDYLQLMTGKGHSRYERASNVAEELKIVAKSTRTIIVCASQVARKKAEDNNEVFIHDAKDSGSIENSSSLVLGVWRDEEEDSQLLKIKVLKNSKGRAGLVVDCNFDAQSMRITERARCT